MKNFILYTLNAFLIFLVGYEVVPNFSLNKDNFNKVSGLIHYVEYENRDFKRDKDYFLNNLISERVVLVIADRNYHEYYISDIYKKYWAKLLHEASRGKEVVLYLSVDNQNEDPYRIEIDGEVIYDTNVRYQRNTLILIFTLILTLFNLYHYFEDEISKSLRILKSETITFKNSIDRRLNKRN